MTLNPSHEAHVGRVAASFILSGTDLDPEVVTRAVGVSPDASARRGDARFNAAGRLVAPHPESWWKLSTRNRVESKDLNEHLRVLLSFLLPHRTELLELSRNGQAYFDVLWESSYLYAGTGPVIDPAYVQGIAALGAGVGFDIYQIEAEPSSEPAHSSTPAA